MPAHRGWLGGPRYRKSAVVVVLAAAACSGHDATGGTDLSPNVFVSVSMTGDGDGRVDVSSGAAWSCTIAVGEVTHFGTDVTHAANHCDWETYDAGGGGRIAFHAVPGSGSVFGGWGSGCTGSGLECTVEWLGGGGRTVSVSAEFLFSPNSLTVDVANHGLIQGMTTQATANYTASRTLQSVRYEWTSSDPSVASVAGTGSQAIVTALGEGTTLISATTRGVTSNEEVVNVAEVAQQAKGILSGVVRDVDGTTPLDSVYISGGPVEGSPGTAALRWVSGREIEADPDLISAGGYWFEADVGRYAMFSNAVLGNRWVSTPGDTADVVANLTTPLDLYVNRGYGLDMLDTDVTITSPAGDLDTLQISYRAWNRDLCPGCVPSIAFGVDGTALAVYRFGIPGIYPGKSEQGILIPITVPAQGGTIYAMLVTTSTAGGPEPGLQQYRDVWAANLQALKFVPIGTLVVN